MTSRRALPFRVTRMLRSGGLALLLAMLGSSSARSATIIHTVRTPHDAVRVDRTAAPELISSQSAYTNGTDAPVLPYRVVNLLLPEGETFSSFTLDAQAPALILDGYTPVLAPPLVANDGTVADSRPIVDWSTDGRTFPASPAKYLGTGFLHGRAIASFAVFPMTIEGDQLFLRSGISLRVETRPLDPTYHVVRRERARKGFRSEVDRQLRSFVSNPEAIDGYVSRGANVIHQGGFKASPYPSLEGSAVDYVIVTPDSMSAAFQVLADWKTDKGVPTVVRTTEWITANYPNGSDLQETIRNFAIEAYAKWGITYLLIGGDHEQIPSRQGGSIYLGTKVVPVDMYFGCLDGDWNADHDAVFGEPGPLADNPDLYQEVFVGRLPAGSIDEANLLVSKVIAYETPNQPDYMQRVMQLAEVLFPLNWQPGEPFSQDGAAMADTLHSLAFSSPQLDLVRLYQNYTAYPGSIEETRIAALDSLEQGFNHVNHIGHGYRFTMSVGNGDIVNGDADLLTNGDRLTNLYLLNCTAVAFTFYCLGEHLLKNPNGGAVSCVGANESAFPLISEFYMQPYYDLVFNHGVTNIGRAFAESRLPRTPLAETGDNPDSWTHYIYTILADPEMPLFNGPVEPFNVTHTSGVGLGTSAIQVTVTDSGGPVESATVCLSKGTDDYQVATTDASGIANMAFTAESPGDIKVVVTGGNHSRYESTVPVTANTSSLVGFQGLTVDDDSFGGTAGNGDGTIDAGETVDLIISVYNGGDIASGDVSLVVSCLDAGVTILDDTAHVGVVGAGATVAAGDVVRVMLAPSISDEFVATFSLEVLDGGVPARTDEFLREIHAPELSFVTLRIDDSLLGNGDGVNQNDEEFLLFYGVKNFGTGAAGGLTASLEDVSGGFIFTDSSDAYPDLAALDNAENVSGFQLREPDVSTPHDLQLTVTDGYGRQWSTTFELRPPDAPANIVFDASLGADRLGLTWDPSPTADVDRYNIYRSLAPGGPYTLASVDPVHHTTFVDYGLQPTTRYYYTLTAVDSSGNESVLTSESSTSTNPAQMEGWPITMALETVSSPVVGDIDGDQDFELVQGNGAIYAWHHNGHELIDKDSNPQTYGVLTTLGSAYVSSIALADIDAVPGLDIIAASRDTKQVFVFDYNGDPLPGWPQTTENPMRAGMVAADINNDDQSEVIGIDENGVLYVWNADGTEYRDGDANPLTPGVFARFNNCVLQYGAPAVADLDFDGLNEIIVGTTGSEVQVLNEDGTSVAGWPVTLGTPVSGSIAVGDIDGDGGGDLELVVHEQGGFTTAYHHDASILYTAWFPNYKSFGPSPALGDLTGDGKLETVIPSSNKKIYAIAYNGGYLPGWPLTYSLLLDTESSPVIADIDYDGSLDVVLGDESRAINAWDVSGTLLQGFPLSCDDAVRATPNICDLDKDGDVDLVVAGWDKAVRIWDFPRMFNPQMAPWSSYHANLYNDGNIDTQVPTGINGVSFEFLLAGEAVDLRFYLPIDLGIFFDVYRAEVDKGDAVGDYERVASRVNVNGDGLLAYRDGGVEAGRSYAYRIQSVDDESLSYTTRTVYVPVTRVSLKQNYPNPFNPTTRITFTVPDGPARPVELVVYDVRGARVRGLVAATNLRGRHTVEWDGRNDAGERVGSGVYFYRLVRGDFVATRKMVLLK